MDVKSLYTFIAIADHGSFAKAAASIGLSVSGVSTQMRSLEADVGQVLFDRSRRPPVLTPEGHAFAGRAREVLREWEKLSASLQRDAGSSGVLKVGAVHTAVSGLLPGGLLRLRHAVPELSIRLTTGLSHDLEAALRGGRIDVAVVTEPENVPADWRFRAFCEERLVLIAHEGARGATQREILESNPYVRFSRMARVAGQVDQKLQELGIHVTSDMEVDSLEGVISLVATGLGVSVVPERIGPVPFPPTITATPLGAPVAMRRMGLLNLADNPRAHFTDHLFEALVAESAAARAGKAAVSLPSARA